MTDFLDIIKGRRSIRKYQEKEISDALLNQILESVQWAPSWANTQCWEVIVVKDAGVKKELAEAVPKSNPARKHFTEAPVILVLCGKLQSSGYYKGQVTTKFGDWFMFDLGLAAQNIVLTAHQLGLGTVITGLFDHEKAASVMGVPEGYELVSLIPLGYPAHESSAPKRRAISDFIHYDKF